MDLKEYNFELHERINQFDNNKIDIIKMIVNPDTGEFVALKLPDSNSDYISVKTELKPDNKLIEENNIEQYLRCNNLLRQNSFYLNERSGVNGKLNLRITYLNQVRQRYLDWFRRNKLIIHNSEISRIASKNNINTVDINLDSVNDRMMAIISVLDSLNGKEITGDMLLIHADNIIGTQTSYMRVSEIFKTNRKLYHAFISNPRKGIYKMTIN